MSALLPFTPRIVEAVALVKIGAAVKVATPVTAKVDEKDPVVADIAARVVAPVTPRVPGIVIPLDRALTAFPVPSALPAEITKASPSELSRPTNHSVTPDTVYRV